MSEIKQTESLAVRKRDFSLLPSTFGEAREMAVMIANSDFAPKDYKGKPENVIIAIQMGADLGLKPMQSLQNIAVINGRPSIYGDAALALVMPDLERFKEFFEGDRGTDKYTAVCITKRRGWPDETRTEFSVADAKRANLWGKQGPWTSYPDRMLMFRARGFNLRAVGADRLLGLVLAEEAQDYPSIDGQIVSSEVVPTPDPLQRIPEEFREQVLKGFEATKISNGVRLTKLNEFLGPDVDPKVGAQALVEWLRDEFAKQKSGKPRQKKGADNGKAEQRPQKAAGTGAPVTGTQAPANGGSVGTDVSAPPAQSDPPLPETATGPKNEPQDADLF